MSFHAGSVREGTQFLLVAARVKFAMRRRQTKGESQSGEDQNVNAIVTLTAATVYAK